MTLTKKKMVREIGRRTRLTNRQVQEVVETLVDVWTEALVDGEKIEIQNFLILEVNEINFDFGFGFLTDDEFPIHSRKVVLRTSKQLRKRLKNNTQQN